MDSDGEALPTSLHHLLSPSHPGKRKTLKKAIAKLITEDDEHTAKKRRQWLEMIEQARGGKGYTGESNSQFCIDFRFLESWEAIDGR